MLLLAAIIAADRVGIDVLAVARAIYVRHRHIEIVEPRGVPRPDRML